MQISREDVSLIVRIAFLGFVLVILVWLIFMNSIYCSGTYGQPNCTSGVVS